jgi:hypothetical protein
MLNIASLSFFLRCVMGKMMLNIDLIKIYEEARKSGEKIPTFLVSLEIDVQYIVDQYTFFLK